MTVTRSLMAPLVIAAAACGGERAPDRDGKDVTAVIEDRFASRDGVSIAYTAAGDGATSLLFVHGWSCNRGHWADQIEAFAGDYRVVALDLAGHGDSGAERESWNMAALGEDVAEAIEHLDLGPVVVVGHSMGGPVALEAARRVPDRVAAVIAVDSLHNAEFEYPQSWLEFVDELDRDFAGACGRMTRSMFLDDADPAIVERVSGEMCSTRPEVARALARSFPDYDFREALRRVSVPIRCINAGYFPTEVEINRRYAADYDAVIMPGVGHFPMIERPAEFNVRLAEVLDAILGPTGGG